MSQVIRINPEQTALLVIDVQRALFTRPTEIPVAYKLIDTINSLVARARLFCATVIYIQHANQTFLKEGSEGWQIHPGLKPTDTDLFIRKKQGNAFLETNLQSDLEARGIKNLLITGLVTEGCVRATSLGGLKLGYQVFLVHGAHSTYARNADQVIEVKEQELQGAGVVLVSPTEIDFT